MKYDAKIQWALDKMDTELLDHCMSVQGLTRMVCREIGMGSGAELMEKAALLHDIGKIFIPQTILDKPGKLTKIEREVVDLHAYFSYRVLMEMGFEDIICQTVLLHHGRDKPCVGGKPDIIPQAGEYAEILRTVDAFDALTSDRPYRDSYPQKQAVRILREDGYSLAPVIAAIEKSFI